MKRNILLLISIVVVAFQLNAQNRNDIPNPSFEDWDDENEEPVSWSTPNPYTALAMTQCVFKETDDPYDGNFSSKLVSVAVKTFKVPGVVTLGWLSVDILAQPPAASIDGGMPWNSRPAKLKGQFKYDPFDGDTCAVIAIFTRYIPTKGKRDTLGFGAFYYPAMAEEWTEFSFDINYFNAEAPDSVNIIVSSSSSLFDPVLGSTMWVDALEFEGEAGIALDIIPEVRVNVYPNPASDHLTFEFEKKIEQSDLIIYNLEGQAVRSQTVNQQKLRMEVGDLPAGTYYFHVLDGTKRLSSGSFLISE